MTGPTTHPPWTRDIPVDGDLLASVVRGALGTTDPLRPLGSGWDFDTWIAGDWVVRVPKRQSSADAIRDEAGLCAWLTPRLPWRIPAYETFAELPGDPPVPVGFYRRVPGRPAIEVDPARADLVSIGRELGEGFRALHALDPGALPTPLPGLRMRTFSVDECVVRAIERLPALARIASPTLARRVEQVLRGPRPPTFEGPAPIVHADIHGEHLLLTDSSPARLSGVIDWGDARRADPALDFACPTFWGGEPLLQAALTGYGPTGYGGENKEALAERVRFLALCLGFLDVDFYVRTDQRAYANAAVRCFETLTSTYS